MPPSSVVPYLHPPSLFFFFEAPATCTRQTNNKTVWVGRQVTFERDTSFSMLKALGALLKSNDKSKLHCSLCEIPKFCEFCEGNHCLSDIKHFAYCDDCGEKGCVHSNNRDQCIGYGYLCYECIKTRETGECHCERDDDSFFD